MSDVKDGQNSETVGGPDPDESPRNFEIFPSVGLEDLLEEIGGSFAFSSYQSGKVFLVGRNENGAMRANERTFRHCMGMARSEDGRRLYFATQHELFRLDEFLQPGEVWQDGSDAMFVPRKTWITGNLDAHDLGLDQNETPVFVNTLFNCIARAREGYSFEPIWMPPHISKMVPEDRCHLNGLAMENGAPRYVTCVSTSDAAGSWRDHRETGGVVIDVTTNEVVCDGLSMPHSPRVYGGELWVLNSGRGEVGWVDLKSGRFVPIARVPGYARGLSFAGPYALVGLSKPRHEKTFSGLPLDDILASKGVEPYCGVTILDLRSGKTAGGLKIEGAIREIYDTLFLPGPRKPSLMGFLSKDLPKLVSIAPMR